MRLDEPIECPGSFWLPGDVDDKLSGVMRVAENGEVTLELAGAFTGPAATVRRRGQGSNFREGHTTEHPTRILGVVQEGGAVTLDECISLSTRFQMPSGLAESVVYAGVAYLGVWFGDDEDILFQEMDCSLEGLEVWLWTNTIESEFDREKREGSIRYRLPDDIPLLIPDCLQAKFVFGLTRPTSTVHVTETSIQQTVRLSFKLPEAQPTDSCLSLASRFCMFLSLALNQDVGVSGMTGYAYAPMSDSRPRRLPVRIYGSFGPRVTRQRAIRWHEALFVYASVADRIDTLIANWLNMHDTFGDAINLYFDSKNQTAAYLDTEVLWLAQALETFHRKTSDETSLPAEEFYARIASIMQRCSPHERQWLQEKLRYANELSFRVRLRKLVEPFKEHFGSARERRTFINTAYDTRNFLTHYDEETTPNRAVEPADLFDLREKLQALFQLHLLQHVGFDHSEISEFVANNSGLRRKLVPVARGKP